MNPTLRSLPAAAGEVGSLVEVLGDETIGGYEVTVVTDGVAHMILRGIEQFCNDVRPHDQVLVYFSCHGMLDGLGKLYFAATDTEPTLLGATAVESDWVMRQLDGCRSRCQILMLDCCYSGASVMGAMNDAEPPLITRVPEVAGRCVLTASRPREYAFDGVFTGAVVNGLRTGDADYDGDGLITPAELFGYVETCARASAQGQNPTFSIREAQGQIPLAYSPRGPMSTTMSPPLRGLPPHVLVRLNRPEPRVRIGAVAELEDLASTDLRPLALDELKRVASQDIRRVAQVAEAALTRAAAKGGPRPELDRKLIIGLLGAIAVIGAAVLALINSGGQPVSASLPPPPVVVGAMYPTDAASKTAREQIVDGEQFAVDYINNRDDLNLAAPALRGGAGLPGLRGARLKLAPVPSGTACEAGAAFDKLVDDYHPVA
ncbi:MAG: hypothetical protein QOJ85_77, partial [Solirubrobacteraceae bacterium]|nr:hypothetical protein [Solirubrobacteraceae bacterium]